MISSLHALMEQTDELRYLLEGHRRSGKLTGLGLAALMGLGFGTEHGREVSAQGTHASHEIGSYVVKRGAEAAGEITQPIRARVGRLLAGKLDDTVLQSLIERWNKIKHKSRGSVAKRAADDRIKILQGLLNGENWAYEEAEIHSDIFNPEGRKWR